MVGILTTPALAATSGKSSVQTSTTSIRPANCFITSRTTGLESRHGPHHGAEKNTRTGRDVSLESTSDSNCSGVVMAFPPDLAIIDSEEAEFIVITLEVVKRDFDGSLVKVDIFFAVLVARQMWMLLLQGDSNAPTPLLHRTEQPTKKINKR
mmetsp:Transcript_13870/g.18981  ORF Transcript_13870/g.18981 Transcript_13870/m.18981 type:complete len:152 (-) Transcript_13870:119-574(-)